MPSDITFLQLEQVSVASGTQPLVLLDPTHGQLIRVASLMPNIDKSNLNRVGVVEFVYKFLEKCNLTQIKANEGVAAGQRLISFPAVTYSAPKRDSSGELRTQCVQQVVTKLTVHGDFIIGVTS